jgi:hypothetical protein
VSTGKVIDHINSIDQSPKQRWIGDIPNHRFQVRMVSCVRQALDVKVHGAHQVTSG